LYVICDKVAAREVSHECETANIDSRVSILHGVP